ncbi:unnamed protein product [Effrenium voratum]|nr:unnamed protein product [Effrenium voratum]
MTDTPSHHKINLLNTSLSELKASMADIPRHDQINLLNASLAEARAVAHAHFAQATSATDRKVSEMKTSNGIPRGVIVAWSGTSAEVPTGWHLCDGRNSTPDLVGRFILAAQEGQEHQVGGTWKVQLSVETMPSHRHTGVTESNVHSHWYDRVSRGSIRWKPEGQDAVWDGEYETKYAQDESSESSHFHSFTTDFAGKGEPLAIANPYYSLAYIMKL